MKEQEKGQPLFYGCDDFSSTTSTPWLSQGVFALHRIYRLSPLREGEASFSLASEKRITFGEARSHFFHSLSTKGRDERRAAIRCRFNLAKFMIFDLGCRGLEPGTNRLKAEYSTIELATPINQWYAIDFFCIRFLFGRKITCFPPPLRREGKGHIFLHTKEFNIPTKKTIGSIIQDLKTVPLFSVRPFWRSKGTGTQTTKRKDKAMKANNVN